MPQTSQQQDPARIPAWLSQFVKGGEWRRYFPVAILLAAGLVIVRPLWVTLRPPIQDLPQHVAAVRVLTSYGDPSYRFKEYFELTLGRTQYLTVYLLSVPLAKVFGPIVATKAVLSLSLIATPIAILRLIRALKLSPWLACLSLPFVFNVHVAFGFLNFVAAIPLMFLGMALAVEDRHCATLRGKAWLASILALCFFTHVVPFGLLAIVVVALTRFSRGAIIRQGLVLLPSAVATGLWLLASPAGRVVTSFGDSSVGRQLPATYIPIATAMRALPEWIIHVTTDERESFRLVVLAVAAMTLLVLGAAVTAPPSRRQPHELDGATPSTPDQQNNGKGGDDDSLTFSRIVVLSLVPLSIAAYFALPSGYGFIWPICQRFPVLAILLGIPLFGRAPGWSLRLAAVLAFGFAVAASSEQSDLYRQGGINGYAGFDEVIQQIPKGSRVVSLIFDRQLEGLQLGPLMHSAGWVQAERGGVSTFSFAEFPSSPFTYRSQRRPPAIPPRWEWRPDLVSPDRDLGWYEYCLVRGWSGTLQQSRRFSEVIQRGEWSLWRRKGPADPSL